MWDVLSSLVLSMWGALVFGFAIVTGALFWQLTKPLRWSKEARRGARTGAHRDENDSIDEGND